MPRVSVIIPVYGVEKYIERCARSLFEQTLDDMEFIFVDDCTKDNSIQVLKSVIDDYPQRHSQIKVLHHDVNKGLSHARETGLKEACGDYIGHCDSDDWVEKDMYERMYDKVVREGLDFLRCAYRITDGSKVIQEKKPYCDNNGIDRNQIISWILQDRGWNSIWSTLVRSEIYRDNDIIFTDDAMLEDFFVVIQLITYSNILSKTDEVYYNYFRNPSSICGVLNTDASIKKALQAYRNINWISNFVLEHYDDYYNKQLLKLKSYPRRLLIQSLENYSDYKYWNMLFPEVGLSPLFSEDMSSKAKLQYLLAYLRITPLYLKLKRLIIK